MKLPAALIALALAHAANVDATVLVVTTTEDNGPGSLRAAIVAANDGDTIQFDPALNGQIIKLAYQTGDPVIDKNITISGPGPNRLAIQTSGLSNFYIRPGHSVTIEGLLLQYGHGIWNQGSLTVSNCIVRDTSGVFDGGGIVNHGTLTVTNTIISSNRVGSTILGPAGRGGGIFNAGTLTVTNSTITGNSVYVSGGGICNTGMATISNCTISDNDAGPFGGNGAGISNDAATATMEIVNTTISRNRAQSYGGGIHNAGSVTIFNSTLSDNRSDGGGGGIHNANTLEISNTILKTGTSGANLSNQGGTIASHGHNLSNDDGAGFLTAAGDQINADPMLGPLQNNGGPTFTHDLLTGSPAADAGDPNFTPPPLTDQRAFARVSNGRIDIGSLEVQPTPTPTPTQTPLPAQAMNISTRLQVGPGDNAMIGGFIVTGNALKNVAVRGLGPSLTASGVNGVLADPRLVVYNASQAIFYDDDWQNNNEVQLSALGLALNDPREAGLVVVLASPASYTVALSDETNGSGVGLLELYDIDAPQSGAQLANISTRGLVQAGENVMIGGFILGGGSGNTSVALRGIGPSLTGSGINNALADPTLELRDGNGALLVLNDNWQDDSASAAQLTAHGLAPQSFLESGIFISLPVGTFTAILAGNNGGAGIGLVEIYNLQ